MRLGFVLWVLAVPAFAAPNPALDKAAKLFGELNYADANRAVDTALKQPGNDRATLLKILELQGILLATLGQGEKSTAAFSALMSLNPEFALAGNHPPRVTTAFFEARAWAASAGRLEAKPLDAVVEPGTVKAVRVEVTKDPARLVKKVRFFVAGVAVVSPVTGGVASAAPKPAAAEVAWWAQLLGEKDAVLLDVGTATSLKVETAPPRPVVAVAEQPKPEQPKPERPKPEQPKPEQPKSELHRPSEVLDQPMPEPVAVPAPKIAARRADAPTSAGRIAGFGLLGAAAASGGVAIGFGLMANGTKAQVDGAAANSAGQVTGMTQRRAFELDQQQRFQATVANVMTGVAAALAVGGGALVFFGGSNQQVAIVPNGLGLSLAGTLP